MNEWMGGWIRKCEWIEGWMDDRIEVWMDDKIEGWMDGWMIG